MNKHFVQSITTTDEPESIYLGYSTIMSNCVYGVMNKTSGCKKYRAREQTDIYDRVTVYELALILTCFYYTRILRSTVAPRLSMFDMNRYFLPSLINWSRNLELAML